MAKQAVKPPAAQWDGVVRRSLDIELRAVDEEERSVEVTASTDTLDGHGDIVEQTFDLKRYKKNPVVLWLHNSFGFFDGARAEDFLPIGHAENVKIEGGNLVAKLIFVKGDGEDSLPEKVWRRVQQRALRAVSIGFRPGKVTRTENTDTGKVTYRLANNELFEISVVPVPSNPDSVAKAMASEREELSRMAARTAAEADPKPNKRKTMDPELLQKQLEQAKVDLGVAQTQLTKANERITALETELTNEKASGAKLKTEHEALVKASGETTDKLIDVEVDALVGKKITPAQKADFVALRKSAPAQFESIVKGLPELATLKSVVNPEKDTENHAKSGGTPLKIAARLEKVGS